MKLGWLAAGIFGAVHLVQPAYATKLLQAKSLTPCSDDGQIGIDYFSIVFTPGNNSAAVSFEGSIQYTGYVLLDVEVLAYGYQILSKTVDPCSFGTVSGLCPLKLTSLSIPSATLTVASDALSGLPDITYSVPDLDAIVRLKVVTKDTKTAISCVETRVTNDKTVDQEAVAWVLSVITGVGLVTSIILSILGHFNIATHITFRTLLLLGFMQSQAMAGLSAVQFPPIAQSYTQMFEWSVGIVHANFLNTICTWFQRATGGTPSTLLAEDGKESVFLAKRAFSESAKLISRSYDTTVNGTEQTVRGIERVGFRINIPKTNVFMTSYLFYYFVAVCMIIVVLFFSMVLPAINKKARSTQIERGGSTTDWKTFLRGSLYRVVALGYPQICALAMWEMVVRDSAAEVVLAITMWLIMSAVLAFAAFKVVHRGFSSRALNESPAYTLYSDPVCMTKWGFLYINYKAQYYWFMVPALVYTVVKGMIIAFAQTNWEAQAIVLLILEAGMLVATCVVRPYMDRQANSFAITNCVFIFINSIFSLVFSGIFDAPQMVSSVMAVLWALFSAVWTLTLLIWLLISFYYAFTLKEPTEKYKRIDSRNSFRLSENRMTTELLPLEKTARGDDSPPSSRWNIDESAHAQSNSELQSHLRQQGSRWNVETAVPHDHNNEKIQSPLSPFNDVLEPTLPLIPSSTHSSARRSPQQNAPPHVPNENLV
ncbi:hypothetical protein N7495_000595 [Penicillium taxi]|uniref:uncharacterized protein n=1 Tax=Penicillium taxi TaxID=168475 RepID=UPI002544EA0A|nr:uncharacterized protein N7495_000595 [Penicillium taxi]KAJ5907913.1 hypothetical protein N7495_000595 [Penicillium taxi]